MPVGFDVSIVGAADHVEAAEIGVVRYPGGGVAVGDSKPAAEHVHFRLVSDGGRVVLDFAVSGRAGLVLGGLIGAEPESGVGVLGDSPGDHGKASGLFHTVASKVIELLRLLKSPPRCQPHHYSRTLFSGKIPRESPADVKKYVFPRKTMCTSNPVPAT